MLVSVLEFAKRCKNRAFILLLSLGQLAYVHLREQISLFRCRSLVMAK